MTRPDYKELCAELAEILDGATDPDDLGIRAGDCVARARAALAEEAVERLPDGAQIIGPTERTVLVPAPRPIPVSDRLPGPEDCDAEGLCWWWDARDERDIGGAGPCWRLHGTPDLVLSRPEESNVWAQPWTHWLPAHALPIPENTND